MDGLLHVIDMLGRTIAQMEQQLEQQRQVIETLSKQINPPEPIPSPTPPIDWEGHAALD